MGAGLLAGLADALREYDTTADDRAVIVTALDPAKHAPATKPDFLTRFVAAVAADVAYVVSGHPGPTLATHISYLVSTPLLIPAGVALTYKKFDRWGLLIVAVATLIAAIMIVRQVQTLGILFGYLNVG